MINKLVFLASCLLSLQLIQALDNGLGRTPAMGWNSWNLYACNIHEDIVRATADALVASGLRDLGFVYVTIDDCWQTARNASGIVQVDTDRFPSGMKALGEYIHSRGLQFGIYSSAGIETCVGERPGSLDYESIDADMYASWGVDLLKYDNCYNGLGLGRKSNIERYTAMRDALNATGRPIYYAMCNWGQAESWEWAGTLANSWRTTGDIGDLFTGWSFNCPCTDKQCWMVDWLDFGINTCSVTNILDKHTDITRYSAPGGFNDLDMLEVGNGGMTHDEYKAHFSLWAALKSPLILGNDVANMTIETASILKNAEIIAVNQDPLGISAGIAERHTETNLWGLNSKITSDVWTGPLVNGDAVVVLFNRDTVPRDITFNIRRHLPFYNATSTGSRLRDLWAHADIPWDTKAKDSYTARAVPSHGVVVLRVFGVGPWATSSIAPDFAEDTAILHADF